MKGKREERGEGTWLSTGIGDQEGCVKDKRKIFEDGEDGMRPRKKGGEESRYGGECDKWEGGACWR